jgi:DNA-binding SARP family transcriptional activator/DNA-binding beta-propeller fold protein YncE
MQDPGKSRIKGAVLKVFLTGRVAVETDGVLIDEAHFPGRQGRLLFAYLAAEQGRPVPRDELAAALWGDAPPPTWDKALTVLVSKLRTLLAEHGGEGANVLTGAFGCYRLDLPEESWVDVCVAASAAQEAEAALAAGDLEQAKAEASLAVSFARRPFLPGEDGAWVEEKRRELAEVRGRALNALGDACLRSGDAPEAAKWAEQTISLEPFRETGYRRLMEAHAAAGNRAEALRVYDRCRRLLADELGTYPSPETESIYRRLLDAPSANGAAAVAPEPPTIPLHFGPATLRGHRLVLASVTLVVVLALATVAVLVTRRGGSGLAAIAPDSIAVVDPLRNAVVADIPLHTRPAAIAYGAGSLWVATKDDQTLLQVDPRTHKITRTIGLGVEPSTIATEDRYVWVLCAHANALFQFDSDTGTLVRKTQLGGTIRVGPFKGRLLPQLGAVSGTAPSFDLAAGAGAAWIGYGDDVVARVDAETGAVRQIAAGSSFGIAFGGGAAWSVSGSFVGPTFGTISRIDARRWTVTAIPRANVGADPQIYGIAAGPHGVWAISQNNKRAWKIDPDLARVTAVIPLDRPPADVAVGAGAVWTANTDGTLSRIDNRTAAVVKTIPFGRYASAAYPVDLAIGKGVVWVALH